MPPVVHNYPMVAWHRYGTGKCLSISTDRLWRLRFKTGDKYHWRLWSQCIQFLTLSRLMGEHKRIRLETDRSIYSLGDQVRLYAHVLDEDFEPVIQPSFQVEVVGEASAILQRVSLQPDSTSPGLYEGYFYLQYLGTIDSKLMRMIKKFQIPLTFRWQL